ncbi:uncharacterized protein LOC115099651 [Rhinatrema bivittatum]|uniref:uncharacterized protein LOC115099651 n=1 Tax=Rhinatrema bivittatum TaxID=194408 RepID=UPI0011288F09|nr:uncharacterized protein LOC115099651 [Rhinatrema bivittatum]
MPRKPPALPNSGGVSLKGAGQFSSVGPRQLVGMAGEGKYPWAEREGLSGRSLGRNRASSMGVGFGAEQDRAVFTLRDQPTWEDLEGASRPTGKYLDNWGQLKLYSGGREVSCFADDDEDDGPGTSTQEAWREREVTEEMDSQERVGRNDGGRKVAVDQGLKVSIGPEPGVLQREQECVWVTGHSFIHWAAIRAEHRPYGLNLGLDVHNWTIRWLSHRGMKWDNLMPFLQTCVLENGLPKVLLIHLGGNDVGEGSCKELLLKIKKDFSRLLNVLPGTRLGWSDIILRLKFVEWTLWRTGVKKLNKQIGKWLEGQGGFWVTHEWAWEVIPGYFRSDGIHLSDVGIDLFNNTIQESLERIIVPVKDRSGGEQ